MPLAIFILASAIVLAAIILSVTKHKETEAMSAALDRLTASINALPAKAEAVIAAIAVPTDEAALVALADQVDAVNAKLDAATPPAPESEQAA